VLLIDTPMHNFTLPATLKSWIVHVVRPGRTFRSSADGKLGLLADRPVYLIVGGGFGAGNAAQPDFLTPYLHRLLATIGLTRIEVLRLGNLLRGDAAIDAAEQALTTWLTSPVLRT
jgi:FMN-dependent NADH-azoreductase